MLELSNQTYQLYLGVLAIGVVGAQLAFTIYATQRLARHIWRSRRELLRWIRQRAAPSWRRALEDAYHRPLN